MSDALFDAAYKTARANYKAATIATSKALDARFGDAGFDTIYRTAERAMQLHIAAMTLAQRVWARTLPYEKAEEIIQNQFPEFPAATRQKAFSDAHTDTR